MEPAKSAVPRGTVYIGMQGAVTYVAYFVSYVVLTRLLTPVEIGKLPLLNAIMAVYGAITILSLQTATTKFVSEYAGSGRLREASGVAWAAIRLVAAVSIPAFILLAFFSPQVSELIFGSRADAGLVTLTLLAALVSDFGALLVSLLWGLNLFSRMVTCNLAGVIMGRVFGLFLTWIGLRLPGFIIGWVIGSTTVLALSIVYARPHLQTPSERVPAKSMLAYSYPILFTALIALVQSWADVTILYGLTGSLVSTGVYYLGLAGAGILSIIAGSLTSAIFPTLSAMYGRGDIELFKEALRVSQRVLNVTVIPIGFALASVASTAVTVAYGKAYLTATIPFAILTASAIVPAYLALMVITLQAVGRTQPLIKIGSAAALTEVALTATLVLPLNVVGSALARFGMSAVAVLLAYGCVKGTWWPRTDRTSLGKGLVLSALVSGVLFAFDSFTANAIPSLTPLGRILLDGAVFLFVYASGLIALKPFVSQDIDLLKAALPPNLQGWLALAQRWIVSEQ